MVESEVGHLAMDFKCVILIVHLKKLPEEIGGVKHLFFTSFKTIWPFCAMLSGTVEEDNGEAVTVEANAAAV